MSRFAKFTWFALVLNLLVILWGGLVSASGSGEGCGASWPLCAEAAQRDATSLQTFVELFHRATSGLALLVVIAMYIWSRRHYAKGHRIRRSAFFSVIFIFIEAAIGALIVIFGLVNLNESLARAFTQPIHLVNTYLLLAWLGLTTWFATFESQPQTAVVGQRSTIFRLLSVGAVGILAISVFGVIASLASTLFPSESFIDGVQKDFARDVHYLVRLRIWHPIMATLVGVYLLYMVRKLNQLLPHPHIEKLTFAIPMIFGVQYAFGALNAILLSPIWLQLLHLLMSDILWLCVVWLGATAIMSAPATAVNRPSSAVPATD